MILDVIQIVLLLVCTGLISFVCYRFKSYTEAYQESPMVKVAIEQVIAEEFCQDRLAPIVAAYEDEKARILADMD